MDPALVAFDFAKAGAILADMIVSYLAAGAPPFDPEEPDDNKCEDHRQTSVPASLCLRPPINNGASPLPPGEYGAPIQSVEQSRPPRLEARPNPNPRSGSWSVGDDDDQPRGLQSVGWGCRDGPCRRDLLLGSVAAGAFEPGLASPSGALRHHRHPRHRRRRLLRSCRVQRQPDFGDEGNVRAGGVTHYPR